MNRHLLTVSILIAFAAWNGRATAAGPSKLEGVSDGVWLVRDDAGVWAGRRWG